MNCPYCNKEMKTGSIETGRGKLTWIPDGDIKSFSQFLVGSASDGSIDFGKWNPLLGRNTSASYCPECKKIIIDM